MVATINEKGCLIVKGTSELEWYALRKWYEENEYDYHKVPKFLIDFSGEDS